MVRAALQQFYTDRAVPPEIHLPVALDRDEDGALARWLETRAGRRVRLHVPRRGDARGLLELAARNAGLAYEARYGEVAQAHGAALDELRAALGLPARPRRVECFDISTIQGAESVASMVVCEDGSMRRSEYRKYRIRNAALARPDDFAAMEEVVLRRYRRLLEQGGPFPDLVIVDGGKGQLSAAYKAFRAARSRQPDGDWHRQARRADCDARPAGPDRAAAPQRRPAAGAADPRRGAPLRGDVPPPRPYDARPALGARCGPRHRAGPPPPAAGAVRQRGERAACDARRVCTAWSAPGWRRPCWRISPDEAHSRRRPELAERSRWSYSDAVACLPPPVNLHPETSPGARGKSPAAFDRPCIRYHLGLRPKPPAAASGDPCAPRRVRRGAHSAPWGTTA